MIKILLIRELKNNTPAFHAASLATSRIYGFVSYLYTLLCPVERRHGREENGNKMLGKHACTLAHTHTHRGCSYSSLSGLLKSSLTCSWRQQTNRARRLLATQQLLQVVGDNCTERKQLQVHKRKHANTHTHTHTAFLGHGHLTGQYW